MVHRKNNRKIQSITQSQQTPLSHRNTNAQHYYVTQCMIHTSCVCSRVSLQ